MSDDDVFDIPPEFDELLTHQDIFLRISSSNYEENFKLIQSSRYFKTPHGIHIFIVNFLNAIKYRPANHFAYALFFKKLIDIPTDTINFYQLLKPYTISLFRAVIDEETSYPREAATIAFFYDAFTIGCFTIEEIIDMLKLILSSHYVATEASIVFFFYFSQEISEFDNNFFSEVLGSIMNSEERTLLPEIHDVFDLMNDLFANNFLMLKSWRKHHAVPESFADAILNDDTSLLRTLVSKENSSNNETVPPNIFGLSPFVNSNPTLIQYASFFGAVKCFKFLLLSDANLSFSDNDHRSLIQFAVAGGNPEIVHILGQKNVLFSRSLAMAVTFHHSDLFEWILENHYNNSLYEDALPIRIDQIAMQTNNAHALEYCMRFRLNIRKDFFTSWEDCWFSFLNGFIITHQIIYPEKKINLSFTSYENHYSPLHWAVKNRYDGLIEQILSVKGVNMNAQDDYGKTPFFIAAEKGFVEILLILKKRGVEINKRAKNNLSPIHAAIRNNQNDSIRFLLLATEYDLNLKDSVFIFNFNFNVFLYGCFNNL